MKSIIILMVCVVSLAGCVKTESDMAEKSVVESEWVPLFNGTNLEDWKIEGGTAKYTVEDSAIVGTTTEGSPNTFLCKGPYKDFILECEVLCDTLLNSGIQIRSHIWEEDIEKYQRGNQSNIGHVYGYQCEISLEIPHRCGHFWDEHRRRKWLDEFKDEAGTPNPYKVGEWNKYRIVAQGNHIQSWINGEPVADLYDDMDTTGFIGLQVHSIKKGTGPYQIRWRNIRIKELNSI